MVTHKTCHLWMVDQKVCCQIYRFSRSTRTRVVIRWSVFVSLATKVSTKSNKWNRRHSKDSSTMITTRTGPKCSSYKSLIMRTTSICVFKKFCYKIWTRCFRNKSVKIFLMPPGTKGSTLPKFTRRTRNLNWWSLKMNFLKSACKRSLYRIFWEKIRIDDC